jgi:hypothetical protein
MDAFSTELEIQLNFVKTSEFWAGVKHPLPPPRYTTEWGHPVLQCVACGLFKMDVLVGCSD